MSCPFFRPIPLALVALLSSAGTASAEVKLESSASGVNPALVASAVVSVQCWQAGVSIIEKQSLERAHVTPLLPATSQAAANGNVGLTGRTIEGREMTLVPLGEALCLIQSAEQAAAD